MSVDFVKNRSAQYARSLPVRVAIAACVILIILAFDLIQEKDRIERPAAGSTGVLGAHQEGTEAALRIMAARPIEPDKNK